MYYQQYVDRLMEAAGAAQTNINFSIFVPAAIDYAEQRIYRDMDLLTTQTVDLSLVSSGARDYALPTNKGKFIVVDAINILSSAGTRSSNGYRNSVTPVTREVVDTFYPSGQLLTGTDPTAQRTTGVPEYFAMVDDSNVIFGPAPDQPYYAEVIGTQRPSPLTSTNSSTWLTKYLPDLFLAASCVFGMDNLRDFGVKKDSPQVTAQSWEAQYQLLLKSALSEEVRKKYWSEGWTPQSQSPVVTPPRE